MKEATESDLPHLIEMGRQFHVKSSDADVPFDEPGTVQMFAGMIASPNACVFITDDGFICGVLTTLPYLDKSFRIAQECFWWAGKSGAKLEAQFVKWAREKRASKVVISHREGRNAAFERLYRRLGYEPYEHYYQRSI